MLLRASAAALLVVVATPAEAAICTLSLPTGGTLSLSSDGLRLGSEEATVPTPGTLTVLSVGSSTLTVDPPVLTQSPAGYQSAGETREMRYSAPLSGATQAYTTVSTSFTVPNLINPVLLTLHARITNPAGFAAGTYQARTVVTCS